MKIPFRGRLWPLWLSAMVAAGCSQQGPPAAPPPPKVVATSPLKLPVVEWDEYVGRLDPIEEVEVRARVSGHLESTHFTEGQIVKAGDLLVVLDQRPFRLAVEQAEADVARASARAEEAAATLTQSEAEVKSAESRRELSALLLGRSRRLVAQNASSQEELDVRQTDFKQADADRDVKVARVALSKAAVVTAAADVRSAKSQLDTARLNLGYTEVRAPVAGRVGRRVVTDGNLIAGGATGATLLTTIVSLDPIHCDFDADERSFLKYTRLAEAGKLADLRGSKKLPILVALGDETKGFPHQGHLDFLDNRMDSRTGTMRSRAILPNKDLSLTPGLFAKVRVPGSARYDAVLIPDSAVGTDQSEKFVLAVDEKGAASRRKVVLGPRARGLRIVREGLDGSERIVLRGLQRVKEGAVVDASFEETVAVDDGLPDDASPLAEGRWIPSYARGSAAPGETKVERVAGASKAESTGGMMP